MSFFIIRTTAGRERQVAERIEKLAEKEKKEGMLVFKSILNPDTIRGYVFVEADSRDEVMREIYGLSHVKGVIEKPIVFEEIKHFIEATSKPINIKEGDIVELTSAPFKNEKAKVKRVNKIKEEVVVELLEAAVPIPMTVSIDKVRLVKSNEDDEE